MEKERSSKVIAIVALLVAVVGLSVGFAAYTATLTISSSATVSPTDDFDVYFSTSGTSQLNGKITPVVKVGETAVENPTTNTNGPKADEATITDTTITGLKAYFTEPGQSVTYTFYAHNASDYVAYLKNVQMNEASKNCKAKVTGTIGVDTACADISISVQVGSGENSTFTESKTGITGHSLAKNGYETVVVTINYANNGNRANGDFDVTFGDITLTYEEVDS